MNTTSNKYNWYLYVFANFTVLPKDRLRFR